MPAAGAVPAAVPPNCLSGRLETAGVDRAQASRRRSKARGSSMVQRWAGGATSGGARWQDEAGDRFV